MEKFIEIFKNRISKKNIIGIIASHPHYAKKLELLGNITAYVFWICSIIYCILFWKTMEWRVFVYTGIVGLFMVFIDFICILFLGKDRRYVSIKLSEGHSIESEWVSKHFIYEIIDLLNIRLNSKEETLKGYIRYWGEDIKKDNVFNFYIKNSLIKDIIFIIIIVFLFVGFLDILNAFLYIFDFNFFTYKKLNIWSSLALSLFLLISTLSLFLFFYNKFGNKWYLKMIVIYTFDGFKIKKIKSRSFTNDSAGLIYSELCNKFQHLKK